MLSLLALCFSLTAYGKATLMPHIAKYRVSLAGASDTSDISGASGEIKVELTQVCEGWVSQQVSDIILDFKDGSSQQIKWSQASFETPTLFRFNSNRIVDGVREDEINGRVIIGEKEADLTYTRPFPYRGKLDRSVLFPVAQLTHIIDAAQEDVKMIDGLAFDGKTVEGAFEFSAFIGNEHKVEKEQSKLPFGQSFWPVRITTYDTSDSPKMESTKHISKNGLIHMMIFNYGDFRLKAELSSVQPLNSPDC